MARTVSGVPVRGSGTASDRWTSPVKDKDLTAPPGAPSPGARYVVASVASGAWTGHESEIAEWAGSICRIYLWVCQTISSSGADRGHAVLSEGTSQANTVLEQDRASTADLV